MIQFKQELFEHCNINTKTYALRGWVKALHPEWGFQAGRACRTPGIAPGSEMREARA